MDSKLAMEHGATGGADANTTDKGEEWLDQNSAGSGPFALQGWQKNNVIALEAPSDREIDWPQVLALYEVLDRVSPGLVVTLNRAVAVAMDNGPRAGLALLGTLDRDWPTRTASTARPAGRPPGPIDLDRGYRRLAASDTLRPALLGG